MELTEYHAAQVLSDCVTDELQEARDIARCEAIKARGEAGVPHDVFMASVEP
jgi:hypothetical protein